MTLHTWLIVLACVIGAWAALIAVLFVTGKRTHAKEVALLVPNLLVLFRGLLRDPRVPRSSKLLVWFAVGWIASPIDLIPEFIPVLGPLDDAVVAALVLRRIVRTAGADVVRDHWRGDPSTLQTILRLARAAS